MTIDASFFIQLGIFLTILVISGQLIFKPFLRIQEERKAKTTGTKDQAISLQEQAQTKSEQFANDYRTAQSKIFKQREENLKQIKEESNKQIQEARNDALATLASGRKNLAESISEANEQIQAESDNIAHAVASRLLNRRIEQ